MTNFHLFRKKITSFFFFNKNFWMKYSLLHEGVTYQQINGLVSERLWPPSWKSSVDVISYKVARSTGSHYFQQFDCFCVYWHKQFHLYYVGVKSNEIVEQKTTSEMLEYWFYIMKSVLLPNQLKVFRIYRSIFISFPMSYFTKMKFFVKDFLSKCDQIFTLLL